MRRRLAAIAALAILGGCSDGAGSKGSNNGENNGGNNGGAPPVPEAYIRGDQATRLVFELDTVDGITAREAARDYVSQKLGAVVDKPDGIEWVSDGTIESRGADHVWTFDELEELAYDQFGLEVAEGTEKIHVMYVDGSYEEDNVLGLAFSNRHIVMFHDVLDASCSRPLLRERLCPPAESSVLLHEVGHVIGLVDNGVDMVADHKDADHGAHDVSEDCVMFWAYEGVGIIDVVEARLTGTSPELDFGEACKADLAAVRE